MGHKRWNLHCHFWNKNYMLEKVMRGGKSRDVRRARAGFAKEARAKWNVGNTSMYLDLTDGYPAWLDQELDFLKDPKARYEIVVPKVKKRSWWCSMFSCS